MLFTNSKISKLVHFKFREKFRKYWKLDNLLDNLLKKLFGKNPNNFPGEFNGFLTKLFFINKKTIFLLLFWNNKLLRGLYIVSLTNQL